MSLSNAHVRATVAVTDIERAAKFYEGVLGLSAPEGAEGEMEGIRLYECGQGTVVQVYATEHAGGSTATAASWSTDEFDTVIAELRDNGAELEEADVPGEAEDGVHTFGDHKVAWVADPDGNVLAIDNGKDPF